MAKRRKMKARKDKRVFSKTADKTHIRNVVHPLRGGRRI